VTNANDVLGEMVTSMANIKESSRKVSNIIKIDEIAFQTNILALNAAVEGRGPAQRGWALPSSPTKCATWHIAVPKRPRIPQP
jgi:hypothetical protein